jgi:hypothetical protein
MYFYHWCFQYLSCYLEFECVHLTFFGFSLLQASLCEQTENFAELFVFAYDLIFEAVQSHQLNFLLFLCKILFFHSVLFFLISLKAKLLWIFSFRDYSFLFIFELINSSQNCLYWEQLIKLHKAFHAPELIHFMALVLSN